MTHPRPAVHRTLVVVDVEGFGDRRRTNPHQLAVRDGLWRALARAFDDAGIRWAGCRREDRGDGVLILARAEVPKARFTESLPRALATALEEHNRRHCAEQRIRLRMAVHAGEVSYDRHGVAGAAVNLAFRLVEADPLRAALADSPGVLGVIASSWFFEEVVRHSPASHPNSYCLVRVAVKETSTVGWICLPGQPGQEREASWRQLHRTLSDVRTQPSQAQPEKLAPETDEPAPSERAGRHVLGGSGLPSRRPESSPGWLLEQLAAAVAAQWNQEAEIRGLNHPLPLSVGWSTASRAMMDRPSALVGGSARGGPKDLLARFSGQLSEVADAFERIPTRRLVVIGDPGAGKTILIVQLVRELLKRRIPGQPVPVLLPITSWNPDAEHVHVWMAARLEETYPALRARAVMTGTTMAMQFIQTNRILPVLDGLDEMPSELRATAVRSLNRALPATDPLVLTSRADEYRQAVAPVDTPVLSPTDQLVEPLAAAAVVELRPLRPEDVEAYLREATPHRYVDKWIPVFICLREDPHGPLARALSTPLMITLARTAYCDSADDPAFLLELRFHGREGIEGHLIDRLIPALYAGRPRPVGQDTWTADQAQVWMSVLALYLNRLGRPDLAWWRLYCSVPAPVFGLLFGLVSGITVWLVSGIPIAVRDGAGGGVNQVAFGVMFAAAAALVVGTERRPPSASAGRRAVASHLAGRISAGLAGGLPGGIVYTILDARLDSLLHAFVFGMANACTVGLTVGLTAGLTGGFSPSKVRLRLQIDIHSVARAMGTGLVIGTAMGIASMAAGFGLTGILGGLAVGLMTGLVVVVRDASGLPADVTQAASPTSIWRADRMNAVVHAVVSGLLGAATIGVVATLVTGPAAGFDLGIAYGAVYAIAAASFTAWYRFIVARIWFRLSGRLPWRLLTFLADAHHRGLLRQVGAVYQFRHARLQDRLVHTGWPRWSYRS